MRFLKGRTIKTEEKIQRRGSETGTEIGQKGKKRRKVSRKDLKEKRKS